jgi:hypothetical protein
MFSLFFSGAVQKASRREKKENFFEDEFTSPLPLVVGTGSLGSSWIE